MAASSKTTKKIDKADRRKGRCWQIPAFSYCSILKGKTKGGRGCWGKRVASKWVVVLRSQQMAWKHNISLHGYTRDLLSQATTHNQASTVGRVFFFFGLKRVADVGRDATPLLWHAGAPRCHLFVILNWQRAKEAEVLHKTLPGMAQCWRTDPSPNPHCYSLMMQRDLQSTHSQTSSRAGWEMKRGGFAVFTRVLYQGTELTANTGLLIEHNLQGFRRSWSNHHTANVFF